MGTTIRRRRDSRQLSIANALFTKGQQRVLGVLFGNPGRSFYANEIIARAGIGTGAVQRELARLQSAGLVTVTRVGNQKHFRANADAPVFAELQSLIRKTSGLADPLRAALAPLGSDITAAFVFGSVARQQDTAESDVDLMVISDVLTYADLFRSLEIASERVGRRINPTVYTPTELTRRTRQGNAFVKRVMAGPKIWVIGGPHDIAP